MDFTHTDFDDQKFKEQDFAGQEIAAKQFSDCQFTRCNFHEAQLIKCRFRKCTFIRCDLSLVSVKGSAFTEVKFDDCKVMGVNWSAGSWSKTGLLNSIHFLNCNLNYSTFFGLTLNKFTITHCTAKDVDFTEANLTKANCTHTDFAESKFFKTNLTEADFSNATHYRIAPHLNTLKKTKFSFPDAMALLYSLDIVLVDENGAESTPKNELME